MPSLQAQAQALANRYLPSEADDAFKQVRRSLARGGRPTTLTEDTIDKLGDSIAQTAEYIEDACLAHGIPRRNYYNWMKQGEADDEANVDSLASRFWRTLKAAESQGLVKLGQLWVENPRDFAAFATRKERRAPGKWARRDDGNDGPRIVVNIGVGQGEVKVGLALSPSTFAPDSPIEDSAKSLTGNAFALPSSPITALMVTHAEACQGSDEASANRQFPASESPGGPTPVGRRVGGQRPASKVKGRSRSSKVKRAAVAQKAREGV